MKPWRSLGRSRVSRRTGPWIVAWPGEMSAWSLEQQEQGRRGRPVRRSLGPAQRSGQPAAVSTCGRKGRCHASFARFATVEPPASAVVFRSLRQMVMKKIGRRDDWWDWGIILLFVAGGTLLMWAGVWVAHS